MSEDVTKAEGAAAAVSEERLRKAEDYIEAEEGVVNRLVGWAGTLVTAIAVAMSLFHLYAAIAGAWPLPTFPSSPRSRCATPTSPSCCCCASCCFRWRRGFATASAGGTWSPASPASAILIYAIEGGEEFTDRATTPTALDVMLGVIFIVLLLEATRRTIGWIVPCHRAAVHRLCLCRAVSAAALDAPRLRRSTQLVGHLFITLEGIFGVPVDVSSTLIILFTIYGAFLQHSGAGKFFIDFSMALMGRKANSAGRTVVLSSFLLGGPSGLRRRDHGDDRRRRLSDDAAGGLREERGRRTARRRRARRHHLAAGARRRRLPDRRVSQDQLSRRDLDGDHPDLPLLPVAVLHGRARCQALRRATVEPSSSEHTLGAD